MEHASGMLGVVIPKFKEKIKQESEKCFDKFKAKLNNSTTVNLSTKVISIGASVETSIVEYAENKNIDLVIIGTRGRTGFKKLLLGSVASGVIIYAHCAVLVVK